MKYKYKVNGLDCANCTQKLEDALNKKEEINDCVISFATGMMTFESNQEIKDTFAVGGSCPGMDGDARPVGTLQASLRGQLP